jgi:hypothetical protein
MNKISTVIFVLFVLFSNPMFSQEEQPSPPTIEKGAIGIGYGQDYGGIGVNCTFYPIKYVGVFGGVGWIFIDIGYNVGIKARLLIDEKSRVYPYLIGMYGYVAAIKVENTTDYNKLFYGTSFGVGLNYKLNSDNSKSLSFAIIYPDRGTAVSSYTKSLKVNHGIVFKNELFPVTFSAGLNIAF